MAKINIECTRKGCRANVTEGGYSATVDRNGEALVIVIEKGITLQWEHICCGKECLMREISEAVDTLSTAKKAEASYEELAAA